VPSDPKSPDRARTAVARTAVARTAVAGTAVAGTAVAGTAVVGTAPAGFEVVRIEVVCTACDVDFDDFGDRAEAVYFADVHNGIHHGKHWLALPASMVGSAHLRID
jgi:hypothetical protein